MTAAPDNWPARLLRNWARHCDAAALRRRRHRHQSNAADPQSDWDWDAVPFNRIALVNHLLGRMVDPAYLEIGCDRDLLFASVPVADKTGIDPVRGGTVRSTSDSFFAGNTRLFDVSFIDGLHTYAQTRRDVSEAVAATKPGGWVLIHDMLPRTWEEEHVPRLQSAWTGDVWKVAVDLSLSEDIDFAVVAIDHGVGIARPRVPAATLTRQADNLVDARFAHFCQVVPTLPILDWAQALAWIESVDSR